MNRTIKSPIFISFAMLALFSFVLSGFSYMKDDKKLERQKIQREIDNRNLIEQDQQALIISNMMDESFKIALKRLAESKHSSESNKK